MTVVVIGIGNEFRGDDGLGPALVRCLPATLPAGIRVAAAHDTLDLVEGWAGARTAIVVDLLRGVPPVPGRRHRLDIDPRCSEDGAWRRPTAVGGHRVDVTAAVELSRVLGTAPDRIVVHGVEGARTGLGTGLSAAVRRALPGLVAAVTADLVSESARRRAPG